MKFIEKDGQIINLDRADAIYKKESKNEHVNKRFWIEFGANNYIVRFRFESKVKRDSFYNNLVTRLASEGKLGKTTNDYSN